MSYTLVYDVRRFLQINKLLAGFLLYPLLFFYFFSSFFFSFSFSLIRSFSFLLYVFLPFSDLFSMLSSFILFTPHFLHSTDFSFHSPLSFLSSHFSLRALLFITNINVGSRHTFYSLRSLVPLKSNVEQAGAKMRSNNRLSFLKR